MMTDRTNPNEKRLVSFFIWDPELEHKIDCEVKMIDGISKLLNVVTTLEQTVECHKALVLSQQRMLAFMSEIQRKQQNLLQSDKNDLQPTKATIILSNIRLPLIWTSMKAKSDLEQKKFSVFCLARIGCEILATPMKSIDKYSTEILFTDKLLFDHVPHNFQLHLEVYALNNSLALSPSVKDFANRYSYFAAYGSPRLSRKLPVLNPTDGSPRSKFLLMAHTVFTKESVYQTATVRFLVLEPPQENSLMQLPIHTSFIARFNAHPLCYTRLATFTGIVKIRYFRYSCVLTGGFLNGEEIMRDDFTDQHRFSIPVTSDTTISADEDRLAFSIHNDGFVQEDVFVEDLFTLNNWIRALQQHIVDMRVWQFTFEHVPSVRRYSYEPLTSSPVSSVRGRILKKNSSLKTKARSLDNLHQSDYSSQTAASHQFDSPKAKHPTVCYLSSDEDDMSVCRTRL